jgi:hypothetical protein
MEDFLAAKIAEVIPPLNPDIVKGIAVKHMSDDKVVKYIDSVLRDVSKNFPTGLLYLDYEVCTPEEMYNFETAKKNSKRLLDIAPSYLVLVKFYFSFNGVKWPHYLYLPYVNPGEAGKLELSGTKYYIHPMLSDDCFSPSDKGVFVRLLRDRLNFETVEHIVVCDNNAETMRVTYSRLYHQNKNDKKLKPSIKALTCIPHYLFCKYGVTETFRKYAKCKVHIGLDKFDDNNLGHKNHGVTEINEEKFPRDEWVIFSSRGLKPSGLGKVKYLNPSRIKLAIRRKDVNSLTKGLIAGFFYVVDYFPERILPAWIDNTDLWKRLLGLFLFSENVPEGKILESINGHIRSLDEYIDNIVALKLKESGYPCSDIYDMSAIVTENIIDWMRKSKQTINSMHGKELTVLYNVLFKVTSAIFKMHYKLTSASKKGLKERDVMQIMKSQLKTKVIYKITKGDPCVTVDSSSTDNMFFKFTTILVPQKASSSGGRKKERTSSNDPSKKIHISVAEHGGFSNLPKSDPTGRSCINPHSMITENGRLMRNPKHVELLDRVQAMLDQVTGPTEDVDIVEDLQVDTE